MRPNHSEWSCFEKFSHSLGLPLHLSKQMILREGDHQLVPYLGYKLRLYIPDWQDASTWRISLKDMKELWKRFSHLTPKQKEVIEAYKKKFLPEQSVYRQTLQPMEGTWSKYIGYIVKYSRARDDINQETMLLKNAALYDEYRIVATHAWVKIPENFLRGERPEKTNLYFEATVKSYFFRNVKKLSFGCISEAYEMSNKEMRTWLNNRA